jgi:hypothetical protein
MRGVHKKEFLIDAFFPFLIRFHFDFFWMG